MGRTPLPQTVGPSPGWQAQAQALLQHGRAREAEALLAGVLATRPRDHAAIHLLGVAARDSCDLPRAVTLLKQAIALAGAVPAYRADLAFTYFTGGRFEEAAARYHEVLGLDPAAHVARLGLGMAYVALRQHAAAAAQLSRFVAVVPDHADAQLHLGAALGELGRVEQSVFHLTRALALRPAHAATHLRYGVVLGRQGYRDPALKHLRRAAELDPGIAEIKMRLAELEAPADTVSAPQLTPDMMPALYKMAEHAILMGRFDEASWCYERALTVDADIPAPYQGLAQVHFMEGRCEPARECTLKAAARGGDAASTQTMLGQIAEAEGNFPAAIAAYESAIAIRPAEGMAQLKLALLRKPTDPAEHVRHLQALASLPSLDQGQRATLGFALARSLEQLGDHDAAFAQYQAANDIRRAQCAPYDDAAFAIDPTMAVFTRPFLQSRAHLGNPSRRPVFVLGMMRSGTTLVEQILASHPQVYGHSELNDIRRISQALPAALGGGTPYPECAAQLDELTARRMAGAYLARLERDAPQASRSVDKMPQNFQHIGLIALLFPNARIIHCTRDPVDTCLSNYFHDFGAPNSYTYDLGTLGGYFRKYQRLMAHWQAVVPEMILDIPYEAMVADQEGCSRRAIAFLGLDWDDACLAFHDNKRAVNTFSVWQVRQPIYQTSINRWEPYRRHLGPLLDALGMA